MRLIYIITKHRNRSGHFVHWCWIQVSFINTEETEIKIHNTKMSPSKSWSRIINSPLPPPPLPPSPTSEKKKEEKSQWTLPIHFMYQDLVNITICFRLHCIYRRLWQNNQRSVLQTLSFHLCITKCCKPYYQCVVITKYSKISHPEND